MASGVVNVPEVRLPAWSMYQITKTTTFADNPSIVMVTAHALVKNGPAALHQVRESAQAMLREGKAEETLEYVLSALESVLVKTQELELLVAKLRRGSWSGKSERMDPAQLSLLLDVMRAQGGTLVEAPEMEAQEDAQLSQEIAAAERTRAEESDATSKPERGTWSNRGAKQQSHRTAVPDSDRACRHCGQSMMVIGADVTRRFEYVPGHFVEHEHQLEKLACGQCKQGVTTAPAPVQVLERSAAGASLFAHVVASKFVDHTPLLAGRTGYIQADAASVFDRLFNGQAASAVEIGCWAHGRRRLVALQDTDCRVAYPLKLIARLYRVEHLADAQGLDPGKRAELRKTRASPILEKLKRWLVTTAAGEPPSSDLAKAASYCLHHWTALTRFVEDGCVSPDNNICESQLRDIALGRKNYLFAGSHDAARRAAALYSLTRTCAQYGVPPLPYFTDVLTKLGAGWPTSQLDDLLPHAWKPPLPAGSTRQQS